MYGDLSAWGGTLNAGRLLNMDKRISHNVIATATDALTAEVTQSVPRPMAVTIGGTYKQRRQALCQTHYYEAKFDEQSVHPLGRQAVTDTILSGLGILRPYRENPLDPKNDRTRVERIFPAHFLIDDQSCIDVNPRQAYIRRHVDRAYMAEIFPKHREDIEQARAPDQRYWFSHDNQSDVVEVLEGWHLASGPHGTDGNHVMVCGDAMLLDEPYGRDRYPLAFVRAIQPRTGFWAPSLVQRAIPAQAELNKLLRRIQESMHLHAVPRVFINRQSGIVKSHVQNDVGIMIEYDGEPPVFLTPASMGADVFEHMMRLEQWIYKEMGVSELSANSRKPPGLDSGAALRTYNDVQSRRWINLERSYEQMHVELAWELARLEKGIAEGNPDHMVAYEIKGRKSIDQAKWKEIELPEDRYRIRIFSASALPNTPAGKLQALEEMVQSGVIDQDTFIQMADMPDFEAVRNLKLAPRELLEQTFDNMLDGKAYTAPEPYQNLELGRQLASLMIQQAELQGAEEEDIQNLRDWIDESIQLEKRATVAAAQEAEAEAQAMANEMGPLAPMGPEPGMAPMPPPPGMAENAGPPPPMGAGGYPGAIANPTQTPVPPYS